MSLAEYTKKRDFKRTAEPQGSPGRLEIQPKGIARYVIQKHAARRLHYDFRLEHKGTLLSWAVPKGPSIDPADKRLAVRVEDHPLEYADFEGTIPAGQYGGGSVLVWDTGTWSPLVDIEQGLKKGKLSFQLAGEKLHGEWHLTRMRGDEEKENWLLIKAKDSFAEDDGDRLLNEAPRSVLTGRSLDEVAQNNGSGVSFNRKEISKAESRKTPPSEVEPQLATLVDAPPVGEEWIHEIKYDGYRILAYARQDRVMLKSRSGKDWTSKFQSIADALKKRSLTSSILDGELIAVGEDGVSNFQALQNAAKDKRIPGFQLRYMAFDLIYHDGIDLRQTPLEERKRALRALLSEYDPQGPIQFSDHVQGNGQAVLENACELGLEGIVSKKISSAYLSRRTKNWLKSKCQRRQEFIVCGYSEPTGSRVGFGALHLAYYQSDGKTLSYAGKVGTGFDEKTLRSLHKQLEKIALDGCPFESEPADARSTTWTRPQLVVEIRFAERTQGGLLRHAVYLGSREDKEPREVRWESPDSVSTVEKKKPKTRAKPPRKRSAAKTKGDSTAIVANVKITHPDRILYPSIGGTKHRIARYYETVASWMLPYVERRPLSLLRHPRGWKEKGFFHKHIDSSFPSEIRRIEIEETRGTSEYGYIVNVEGLVGLLQMGTLEIHPWNSRIDNLEKPDTIVFDLDPADGLPSETVVGAALLLRDILRDRAGLQSFLKTTGGKGLHVVVPIRRGPSWSEAKEFSRSVSKVLCEQNPDAFTLNPSRSKRTGKIYIDYLRNGRGATAIAPYSTRAREGAPVSMPLDWKEATASLRSNAYTIENAAQRLSHLKQDPWQAYRKAKQPLTQAVKEAFSPAG
ncbi:DNA ligase D [Pelagicoccus sp. SDUM812002]|uniref:DNA ligase D n=1 Tax=Pelagicoccus sp. SDUM812002 TaxID=3041266 RepID=UPI00280CE090|nr:DNA ligase D [Pelagicoccus sp. SDUM812002]MDQ8188428.1 DNA ligase D [Pelagicoccus sp. SDUM812002]